MSDKLIYIYIYITFLLKEDCMRDRKRESETYLKFLFSFSIAGYEGSKLEKYRNGKTLSVIPCIV